MKYLQNLTASSALSKNSSNAGSYMTQAPIYKLAWLNDHQIRLNNKSWPGQVNHRAASLALASHIADAALKLKL